jgi:hypothetical protein
MADLPPTTSGSTLPFKDRSTGLILFGIGEILLGCLAGGMIMLMIFGQVMTAHMTQQGVQFRLIVPGALVYGVAGVSLIALGIGSIRARRWARALSLIVAWAWLMSGLCAIIGVSVVLPKALQATMQGGPGMPAGAAAAVAIAKIAALATIGLFFILVPGVLIAFYQGKNVKATCEAHDAPRWTDACPLPVLGLAVWLGVGAGYLLIMGFSMKGVFPVFGVLLSGWSGAAVYLALSVLWFYCARAIYHLDSTGWWLMLLGMILATVSAWVSFNRIDLFEIYRQAGYPEAQIQSMQQVNFLNGKNLGFISLAAVIPMLAYLLFVKRYFHGARQVQKEA